MQKIGLLNPKGGKGVERRDGCGKEGKREGGKEGKRGEIDRQVIRVAYLPKMPSFPVGIYYLVHSSMFCCRWQPRHSKLS